MTKEKLAIEVIKRLKTAYPRTDCTLSQAAWPYNFFYLGNISIGESLDGRIFFEQIHHDYIYAGISAQ